MKKTFYTFAVLFSLAFGFNLKAEEVTNTPTFILKTRVLPIISALTTSLYAERFDHAFVIDAEYVLHPNFSMGLSTGHGRMSTSYDRDDAGILGIDYREEWIFGFVSTYYLASIASENSLFIRPHFYFVITDNSPAVNIASSGRLYRNMGIQGSGSRTGLEVGYCIRNNYLWFEVSGGFSAYLSNPYRSYTGENQHGIPAWAVNMAHGIANVYPTFNGAIGISF